MTINENTSSLPDWLWHLPADWSNKRGKFCFKHRKEINYGMKCENRLALTMSGVRQRALDDAKGLQTEDYSAYQIVEKDDLIFKLIDLENYKTSRVGLIPEQGIVSPAYIRVEPSGEVNSKFGFWFYYSLYIRGVYNKMGAGVRQTLTSSDLLEFRIPIPPKDKQKSITTYLEDQTTKIDKLIALRYQQIDLLKEQRAALIQQAVTRGLNPDVPMKDSGLEWVGEIPAHWIVKHVKTVSSFLTSGPRGWAEYYSDSGSYFLQSGNLNDLMGIELEQASKVTPPDGAEGRRTRLQNNDVLVCVTGANTGRVALATLNDEEVYVNQHLCLIRLTKEANPLYVAYCLYSNVGRKYFDSMLYGLKEGLGLGDVKNAPVFVPPYDEQIEITNYIEQETKKLNLLKDSYVRQIELLQEYRAALIHECVTGQREIRE